MPKQIEAGQSTTHVGPMLTSPAVCAQRNKGRARTLAGPEPASLIGINRHGAGYKLSSYDWQWT
eukprot:1790806-Pleurochrysis_carterae.AAC.1